jgi:hypothetical protein
MSYIAPLKDMLFDIEHLAARMPARRSVRAACNSKNCNAVHTGCGFD